MAFIPGLEHVPPPEVGAAIRRARLARGWSLREAARRVGTAYGYLGALERGAKATSITMAEALIRALGISGDDADLVRRHAIPGVGRDFPR